MSVPARHPWLGTTANGVRVGRLKHVLKHLQAGGTPDTGNPNFWGDDGTPWIAISDMSGTDCVRSTAKSVSKAGIADKRLQVLPPGTLLYSMYASLGHVAELGVPATTNQAILGLAFSPVAVRRYAFWQLKAIQPYVVEAASSNTQDNLNAEKIRNLPFAVPPLSLQQDMANFLDEQTARIDALIAEKEFLCRALVESESSQVLALVTGQAHGATAALVPEKPVGRVTGAITMSAEKTIAVSFRVSPRFKHLLEAAAARERRSQTNMLETLLFSYCEQQHIDIAPALNEKKKPRAK